MKLRTLLKETVQYNKIVQRLSFEIDQTDTGIECWNRLFKENRFSNKIKLNGGDDNLLYRGFSKEAHLKSFLSGIIKPMVGVNGTGVYFSNDKSFAESYAGENGLLVVNLNKKLITQDRLNQTFIAILKDNFKNETAMKLWNRFKDTGLMAMVMSEPGFVISDNAVVVNDFKILNLL